MNNECINLAKTLVLKICSSEQGYFIAEKSVNQPQPIFTKVSIFYQDLEEAHCSGLIQQDTFLREY